MKHAYRLAGLALGGLLLLACAEAPPPAVEEAAALAAPAPAGYTEVPTAATTERGLNAAELAVEPPQGTAAGAWSELEWDALVPADWQPETLFDEVSIDGLDDTTAEAQALYAELQSVWDAAPVVAELDGLAVKLPGFPVPLEQTGDQVTEFLLVPYFGACIHAPPPPANQTVFVDASTAGGYRQTSAGSIDIYEPVWVMGTLRARTVTSPLAVAGYTIEAARVMPYE